MKKAFSLIMALALANSGRDIVLAACSWGADNTKTFVATMGRAGTVGEKSIGYPDAGAYGLGVIFTELAKYIANYNK